MKTKKEGKINLEKFTVAKIRRSNMRMVNGGSSTPSWMVTKQSDNVTKDVPGIDHEP